jgi:hypothetical protein
LFLGRGIRLLASMYYYLLVKNDVTKGWSCRNASKFCPADQQPLLYICCGLPWCDASERSGCTGYTCCKSASNDWGNRNLKLRYLIFASDMCDVGLPRVDWHYDPSHQSSHLHYTWYALHWKQLPYPWFIVLLESFSIPRNSLLDRTTVLFALAAIVELVTLGFQ